jgi:SAM-dependent methyltransferase
MWLEETKEILSPCNLLGNVAFQFTMRPLADGVALPPPRLRVRVCGSSDVAWFLRSGQQAATLLAAIAARTRVGGKADTTLELGCGCARVLRHLPHRLAGNLRGTDIDRPAVRWCAEHLPDIRVTHNDLEPPLDQPSQSAGFVYALSVFTHLPEGLQRAWLDEVHRILRPGGVFAFTFRGAAYNRRLHAHELQVLAGSTCVVRGGDRPGTNHCNTFSSYAHVRTLVGDRFEIAEHREQPEELRTRYCADDCGPLQDLVVCRKPV